MNVRGYGAVSGQREGAWRSRSYRATERGPRTRGEHSRRTDPAATTLHTSSAGHLPPILAAPDDVATTVTIPVDLPLGVKSGRPRHSIHVPLPRGFVLCLYTDGLVERRGVVVDDNIEKLRRTVTVQASEAICIDVMQQLVGPATPEDDVAVLVARDLATAQPTT